MTSIAFHVNLADPVSYACRLLRKACASGAQVVVVGEPAQLRELDQALWTFSPQDFVPHAVAGATPAAVLARTPIVLAPEAAAVPHRQVLVNLGQEVPEGFEGFGRLIELVGTDPGPLQSARVRWKHYVARGLSPERIDQKDVAS